MATNQKAPAKKRAARPAAERAQESLDIANRAVGKIEKRLEAAKVEVTKAEAELTAATKKRDYAAANPDLPAQAEVVEPVVES